jgi:8-oxo-dGTP diphosphatase
MNHSYPRVGVAALVFRNGRLLLGRRGKLPGANSWQCPGGFLEYGESVFDCARRETREETGLAIHNLNYGPYTNNRFAEDGQHTVTLYVVADYLSGELQALEGARAGAWQWCDLRGLPQPLFLPLQILCNKYGKWLCSVAGVAD